MKQHLTWKDVWEAKFSSHVSDYEADRGTSTRGEAVERMAIEELLEFIDPQPEDVVFDAGCGTGTNVLLLSPLVRQIIAMDFAEPAVRRGQARLAAAGVDNAVLTQGDIGRAHLADGSVDKVLCLSVFHYLSDDQVRTCLRSFRRMLGDDGTLIIHVKNLGSLYWSTLLVLKRALRLLGRRRPLEEQLRTFGWYVRELETAGFEVERFNSFNALVVEPMPRSLVARLQGLELTRRNRFPFNTALVRRLGADLKIRARCAPGR